MNMEQMWKWVGLADEVATITAMTLVAKLIGPKHPFLTVMVEARLLQYLSSVMADEDCGLEAWFGDHDKS